MPVSLIDSTLLLFCVKFEEAIFCGTEAEANSAFAAACVPAPLREVSSVMNWPVVHSIKPCRIFWEGHADM